MDDTIRHFLWDPVAFAFLPRVLTDSSIFLRSEYRQLHLAILTSNSVPERNSCAICNWVRFWYKKRCSQFCETMSVARKRDCRSVGRSGEIPKTVLYRSYSSKRGPVWPESAIQQNGFTDGLFQGTRLPEYTKHLYSCSQQRR
ncbi:hypothetical protein SEVIR_3G222550v4 [Setaria viridis]|uniref:Uncharacterized protein n=1 Tax=Setaria viridis TaxID=4556 RepID=A0A4U6VBX9_SETVI|nr:hypothetical protein SEVIR_3G222550v2 [Setaria viridis]